MTPGPFSFSSGAAGNLPKGSKADGGGMGTQGLEVKVRSISFAEVGLATGRGIKLTAPKGSKLKLVLTHVERLNIECPKAERSIAIEFAHAQGFRVVYVGPKLSSSGRATKIQQLICERSQ